MRRVLSADATAGGSTFSRASAPATPLGFYGHSAGAAGALLSAVEPRLDATGRGREGRPRAGRATKVSPIPRSCERSTDSTWSTSSPRRAGGALSSTGSETR